MLCKSDPTIRRVVVGSFQFPLGVYPVEEMAPRPGFSMHFEAADGGEERPDSDAEWEEWPDRYAFDIVISNERLPALVRSFFSLFDGRVYPILDVLGNDGYREIDPYIAYDLVGPDRVFDALRDFADFFFEDGMCGFGAMSDEPFLYVFVDEHKILTVRAEVALKERVDRVLQAFDLEPTPDTAGADAAAHEHRSVLLAPPDRPELLGPDEVIERVRDAWRLLLNVDPDTNVDDQGKALGVTPWRCIVRCEYADGPPRYAEVVLDADCLREAEDAAFGAVEDLAQKQESPWQDAAAVTMDRLLPAQLKEVLASEGLADRTAQGKAPRKGRAKPGTKAKSNPLHTETAGSPTDRRVYFARWLDQ